MFGSRRSTRGAFALLAVAAACTPPGSGAGEAAEDENTAQKSEALTTYEVGPGKPYASLKDVASRLKPGDIVNVAGNATYAGDVGLTASGTAASKITIRGVRVNGKRPILSGGDNTLLVEGDHNVIEGFEITGGARRCVFHHAAEIVIRDTVVHDCPKQGILGADEDSGSLTLDRVEVYRSGGGTRDHQIYMATDESAHPGAIFRMQSCYVHDGIGGNNVKSRAQRNEIRYNWIEGAFYRELELIGPDGQDPALAREDSDVVGNVFNHTGNWYTFRVGGDGTGDTGGRYRFVNNTILVKNATKAVFQLFDSVDSIEMHNNVIASTSGSVVSVFDDADASWVAGRALSGSNNWVGTSTTNIPTEWRGTLKGASPGLASVGGNDLRPTASSPLVNAGIGSTTSPSGHSFPSPLALPTFTPPARLLPSAATARAVNGTIDIGAYEYGSGGSTPPTPTTPPTTPTTPPTTPPLPGACNGTTDATIGGTNLVKNGELETNTDGWDTSDAALARVAGGHCGSYAAKVTSSAADYSIDDLGATLSSPAAATYRGQAWVRSDVSGVSARIVLRERAASGTRSSSQSAVIALSTTWQKISVERTTAAGSTGLEVYVAASGGGAFLVDDIGLVRK